MPNQNASGSEPVYNATFHAIHKLLKLLKMLSLGLSCSGYLSIYRPVEDQLTPKAAHALHPDPTDANTYSLKQMSASPVIMYISLDLNLKAVVVSRIADRFGRVVAFNIFWCHSWGHLYKVRNINSFLEQANKIMVLRHCMCIHYFTCQSSTSQNSTFAQSSSSSEAGMRGAGGGVVRRPWRRRRSK